nr:MAG TPA: protein of unknown function (DUF2016) [Bacteriophage sp.]
MLILGFLFNKYFPPALPLLYRLATLAAPAIFAPFPSIWRPKISTLPPLNTQGHRYCSFCLQNPGRDQIFCLMLFHLDYFY